jgi:tetratricopeptide (TPR) repeat protein
MRTLALLLVGVSLAPTAALAENPAVRALLQQAQYWQSKGRGDLAFQALHRAQAIDPGNPEVKRALAGPAPAPQREAKPAPEPKSAPAADRRPPAPGRPARVAAADLAGRARVAGFAALQENDLATASRQFESALARNRHDGDALGGLGLVALKQGNFARARDLLEQASHQGDAAKWAQALNSARYFAGVGQAQDLAAHGQLDQAQKLAEDLVRSGGGKDRAALELLAGIYDRQGRYADSADLYRQASETGTGAAGDEKRLASRAARGRALAAAARGDDQAAEQEFQQGLLLDPEDPWIRYEFAHYMIGHGRLPEAESLIQSLSASTNPDGLYAAAMLQSDLGHPAAAQALLARIPDTYRTQPMRALAMGLKTDAAIARAKALAASGQKAEAITALRQIAHVDGLPAARQAAIADALYDMGDVVDAGTLAQTAMAGSITDLGGYEAVIRVATRTGRDDLAQTALQRASQLAGTSPDGQRALGRISAAMAATQADRLRLSGQFAEAFDVLQRGYSAAPDNAELLAALARLYQSGNMPARAAQTFQIILQRAPRDRDALSGLMETAQAAGDRALSQQAQARLLQDYPQSYEVYLAAARTEQARGNGGAATRYLKQAREIYNRQMASARGANPFATGGEVMGRNPFRTASAAPAPVNPFALGSGTRLSNSAIDAPAGPVGAGGTFEPGGQAPAAWNAPATPAELTEPGRNPAPGTLPADPVLAQIQTEIDHLSQDNGPHVDVDAAYRSRAGETGLSALRDMKGSAQVSTGLGGGRVYARADAVVIDSGRPTGDSLQRFGRDATIEAQSIVAKTAAQLIQATTQRQSGVAPSIGYADKLVQAEVGATPIGFDQSKATWRVAVTPQLGSNVSARAWFERKPVTDSIVSYGGTRDPVTGEYWGQVMRTGGGAGLSVDHDGNGVYFDLSYNHYAGTNVPTNHNLEANLGGYLRVRHTAHSTLTAGMNLNYQAYGNDQDYFTYGHGGYFSPQSFFSVGFPVNYTYKTDRLDLKGSFTPGFQSFLQDQVNLYPTDPTAQAQLDLLKAQNGDVRNYYDSLSKTGFALAASGSAWYRIAPSTRVGGDISYSTFGSYDETRATVGIRQSLGSSK